MRQFLIVLTTFSWLMVFVAYQSRHRADVDQDSTGTLPDAASNAPADADASVSVVKRSADLWTDEASDSYEIDYQMTKMMSIIKPLFEIFHVRSNSRWSKQARDDRDVSEARRRQGGFNGGYNNPQAYDRNYYDRDSYSSGSSYGGGGGGGYGGGCCGGKDDLLPILALVALSLLLLYLIALATTTTAGKRKRDADPDEVGNMLSIIL